MGAILGIHRDNEGGAGPTAFASYSQFYRSSAYSSFRHEIRKGGSYGLQVMRVDQGPHALTDRATPDLLIGIRKTIEPRPARYHLGDRWIDIDTRRPLTVVAPPRTDVEYDIQAAQTLIILAIPLTRLPDLLEFDGLAERLGRVYQEPFSDPFLSDLAERLWRESLSESAISTLLIDSVVMTIMSALMQRAHLGDPGANPDRYELSSRRVQRVLSYIERHLSEDIRLQDLADVACLSPFHFGRMFKSTVGASPLRYVTERRIVRAEAMLAASDASILTISLHCGFSDSSQFATAFRRYRGLSPSAWRRSNGR